MSQPLNGKFDGQEEDGGEGADSSNGSLLTTKSCPLSSSGQVQVQVQVEGKVQENSKTAAAAADEEEGSKKRVGKGKFKLSDLKPTGDDASSYSSSASHFSPSTGDSGNFSQAPTSSHSNGHERQLAAAAVSDSRPSFSLDRGGNLTVQEGNVVLHQQGVEFKGTGQVYTLSLDQIDLLKAVGKGQYGTVHKVYHRPTSRIMALKVWDGLGRKLP